MLRLPPAEPDESQRDDREQIKENISKAEGIFTLLSGTFTKGWLYSQRHMAFEIVAQGEQIFFYTAVPAGLVTSVEKALVAAYPDIQIAHVADHNIFSPTGKIQTVAGGELQLTGKSLYPIHTYKTLDFDPEHPEQKDFVIQEIINMLYKLYDPDQQGIIGPRFEHWFRQAALTIMADPNGSTFLEVPKPFLDDDFLKAKFKHVTDPTVQDFWINEMGQTSDYHKSEMLGWFVSKWGAFLSNEIMRNIIGQHKSSFNFTEIMDGKKILIVNLSKGLVGENNSKLLGMMFVIKLLAAALARSGREKDAMPQFTLYVDEFQNFSTDSFATILSEARKYNLCLVVANQFIGQLTEQIKGAVFGNVGTLFAYRCGPEDAEFLEKQFEPSFDRNDLVNLPNGTGAIKLMANGLPTIPFTINPVFPPVGEVNAQAAMAMKELSRSKYGRPKAEVDAEVAAAIQMRPAKPAAKAEPAPEAVTSA